MVLYRSAQGIVCFETKYGVVDVALMLSVNARTAQEMLGIDCHLGVHGCAREPWM